MTEKQETSPLQSFDCAVEENPFVKVVTKKLRNLKKKLEKAVQVEQLSSSGKALNEEQYILLQSRPSLERAIVDIEGIKTQLDGLCKEFLVEGKSDRSNSISSIPPQESTPCKVTPDNEPVTEVAASIQDDKYLVNDLSTSFVVSQKMFSSVEVMVGVSHFESEKQKKIDEDVLRKSLEMRHAANVKFLLRALHVYSGYSQLTNNSLPTEVDYFGKTVLGLTSIVGFEDSLTSSIRFVKNLTKAEGRAETVLVPGVTMADFDEVIDTLSAEMNKLGKRKLPGSSKRSVSNSSSSSASSSQAADHVQLSATSSSVDGTHSRAVPSVPPEPSHTGHPPTYPNTILFGQYLRSNPRGENMMANASLSPMAAMGNTAPPDIAMISAHNQMMMFHNGGVGMQYMQYPTQHPGMGMLPLEMGFSGVHIPPPPNANSNSNSNNNRSAYPPGGLQRFDYEVSVAFPNAPQPVPMPMSMPASISREFSAPGRTDVMASSSHAAANSNSNVNSKMNSNSNVKSNVNPPKGKIAAVEPSNDGKPSKSAAKRGVRKTDADSNAAALKAAKDVDIGLVMNRMMDLKAETGDGIVETKVSGSEVRVGDVTSPAEPRRVKADAMCEENNFAAVLVGKAVLVAEEEGSAAATKEAGTTAGGGDKVKKHKKLDRAIDPSKALVEPVNQQTAPLADVRPPSAVTQSAQHQQRSGPKEPDTELELILKPPASKRDEAALARFLAEKSRLEDEKRSQEIAARETQADTFVGDSVVNFSEAAVDDPQLLQSGAAALKELETENIRLQLEYTRLQRDESLRQEAEKRLDLAEENLRLQEECRRLQEAAAVTERRLQLESEKRAIELQIAAKKERERLLREAEEEDSRRKLEEERQRALLLQEQSRLEREGMAAALRQHALDRERELEKTRMVILLQQQQEEEEERVRRRTQEDAQKHIETLEAEKAKYEDDIRARKREDEIRQRASDERARIEERQWLEREQEVRRAMEMQRRLLEVEAKAVLDSRRRATQQQQQLQQQQKQQQHLQLHQQQPHQHHQNHQQQHHQQQYQQFSRGGDDHVTSLAASTQQHGQHWAPNPGPSPSSEPSSYLPSRVVSPLRTQAKDVVSSPLSAKRRDRPESSSPSSPSSSLFHSSNNNMESVASLAPDNAASSPPSHPDEETSHNTGGEAVVETKKTLKKRLWVEKMKETKNHGTSQHRDQRLSIDNYKDDFELRQTKEADENDVSASCGDGDDLASKLSHIEQEIRELSNFPRNESRRGALKPAKLYASGPGDSLGGRFTFATAQSSSPPLNKALTPKPAPKAADEATNKTNKGTTTLAAPASASSSAPGLDMAIDDDINRALRVPSVSNNNRGVSAVAIPNPNPLLHSKAYAAATAPATTKRDGLGSFQPPVGVDLHSSRNHESDNAAVTQHPQTQAHQLQSMKTAKMKRMRKHEG